MRSPLISVVMPVRNMGEYVGQALLSVLNQTVQDIEVIVIADGCTDRSVQVVSGFRDPRIRLHTLPAGRENRIHLALNQGLAIARGAYIARQDADDISLARRFERQLEALESDEGCAGIGTAVEFINECGEELHRYYPPRSVSRIISCIEARTPFIHGSVMMRRAAVDAVGGYREFYRCEDFDLWLRLLGSFGLRNLSEVLYKYRIHGHMLSPSSFRKQHWSRRRAWELYLQRRAGEVEDERGALVAVRRRARRVLLEAQRDYRAQLGNQLLAEGRAVCALREYLRALACGPLRWRSYVLMVEGILGRSIRRGVRHGAHAIVRGLWRPAKRADGGMETRY